MAVGVDGTTLTAFMDAVTEYYGRGVWEGISSQAAFTSADFAAKVTEIDGVSAVYTNAGNVAYYTYNGQIVGSGATIGNTINSNVGNVVESTAIELPANTTISSGEVVAESGMKTAASGAAVQTVVKDVAIAVGAVGAGMQMGNLFSQLAYNYDPQLWNRDSMASLNPQTWSSLVSDFGGEDVFNFVFGIDPNDNTVQAYLDEQAFAYIAGYIASIGGFDPDVHGETIQDTTGLDMGGFTQPVKETSYFGWGSYEGGPRYIWRPGMSTDSPIHFASCVYDEPNPGTLDYLRIVFASESPFTATFYNVETGLEESYASQSLTFNNKTFYFFQNLSYPFVNNPVGTYNALTDRGVNAETIAYIMLYGEDEQISGKRGISQQPGATVPVIVDPTDIAAILQYLKQLYPDLWTDSITNDVVQPDGSIDHHVYVPVSIPEEITKNQTTGNVEPTGGEKLKQQDNTISPTSPEELIKTLTDILESTDPNNPTKNPSKPTTDYPDTGTGTTPTVIIPTGSANALYSIYNPTQSELNSLGAWLWSSNFVDQLLKVFNDPMQAIIGLHKIFITPPTSGTGSIKVGYLDSGVSSKLVSNQYTEKDCGNVNLLEYFGNALDYTHTDIYLYLPFIGIVPLNTVDVMRAKINVKYKVDVLTGACLASVNVTRDGNAGGQLYVYTGNCAAQYPLSSGSYMGILSGALGIAASVAGTIATGGAALPLALGAGAGALTHMRAQIEHSGSIGGNAGALGIKKPYLIIRRPQTKIAADFENFSGSSNNATVTLSSCGGFTRVKHCHLENIPAYDNELSEIQGLLESGVII